VGGVIGAEGIPRVLIRHPGATVGGGEPADVPPPVEAEIAPVSPVPVEAVAPETWSRQRKSSPDIKW